MRKGDETGRCLFPVIGMNKKCPVCEKGELIKANDIVSEINGYLFIEKGDRCETCGEEFIDEKDSKKTIEIARKLGVWPEPLKLVRTLSESGGTLVLRIPTDLERQLNLHTGGEVSISKIGNKIVIEPHE